MTTQISKRDPLQSHLEDEDLIAFLDGEVSPDEADHMRRHLKSCWVCRGQLSEVQGSIECFLRARQEILMPRELPPAGRQLNQFIIRLSQHLSGYQQEATLWQKVSQMRITLRVFAELIFSNTVFRIPDYLMVRLAVASIVVIAASLLFIYNHETTVSASEFLMRSESAQASALSTTAQPIIHQKIRLRRIGTGKAGEESTVVEAWTDPNNSISKKQIVDNEVIDNKRSSERQVDIQMPTLLLELETSLARNRLSPHQPLSATAYRMWSDSVDSKREQILKSQQSDGAEILILKTTPTGSIVEGSISEASLAVRVRDWHPISESFRIRGKHGDEEYELHEISFEIVSLTALGPGFLANPVTSNTTPAATAPAVSTVYGTSDASLKMTPRVEATADLEIEVLELLNQAGANLGEQVSVTRTSDAKLYIQGIVETGKRKAEIVNALQSVRNNPAVIVQISTVAEAARSAKKTTGATVVDSGVISESAAIPTFDDLQAYFRRRGIREDLIDTDIREFCTTVLGISRAALRHGWALRSLSNRFTRDEMRMMTPRARTKWLSMISEHVQAIQQNTRELEHELERIFPDLAGTGNRAFVVNSEAEMLTSISHLVDLCARNDEAVQEAFTVSSSPSLSKIQSRQFWLALNETHALGAGIQTATRNLARSPEE